MPEHRPAPLWRSARRGAFALLCLLLAWPACGDDGEAPRPEAGASRDGAADGRGDAGATDALRRDGSGPDAAPPPTCPAGARTGKAGSSDGMLTGKGIGYNVRTPAGYDPHKGHPLIVVYAAAGGTATNMEPFTGLTPFASAAGFIIAYVDHVSPSAGSTVDDIATVPRLVAQTWCVDTARIYLTGHSDGGSVIYVMLARKTAPLWPAAIAPSAAGLSDQAFAQLPCLARPLSVMVMHGKDDALFPGYGADARDWWVSCNGCSATAGAPLADGCLPYPGCKGQADLRYCEGSGVHGIWPQALNASLIGFFD